MKRESFGTQRGILSGRDIAIRPALVANHREVFGSSRPFIELAISYALYNGLRGRGSIVDLKSVGTG